MVEVTVKAISELYRTKGQPVVGLEAAWWGEDVDVAVLTELLAVEHVPYFGKWKNKRSLAKKLAKSGVDVQVVDVPRSDGSIVLEIPTEPLTPTSEFRQIMDRAIELAEVLPVISLREAQEDADQLVGALEARWEDQDTALEEEAA